MPISYNKKQKLTYILFTSLINPDQHKALKQSDTTQCQQNIKSDIFLQEKINEENIGHLLKATQYLIIFCTSYKICFSDIFGTIDLISM